MSYSNFVAANKNSPATHILTQGKGTPEHQIEQQKQAANLGTPQSAWSPTAPEQLPVQSGLKQPNPNPMDKVQDVSNQNVVVPKTPVSPLDLLLDKEDNVKSGDDKDDPQKSKFDPSNPLGVEIPDIKKLQQVSKQAMQTLQFDEALLTRVNAGEAGAVQELLASGIEQAMTSMLLTNMTAAKGMLNAGYENMQKGTTQQVSSDINVSNALTHAVGLDQTYKHPVARGMLETAVKEIYARYPDASYQEAAEQAVSVLRSFGGNQATNDGDTKPAKEPTDWSKMLR